MRGGASPHKGNSWFTWWNDSLDGHAWIYLLHEIQQDPMKAARVAELHRLGMKSVLFYLCLQPTFRSSVGKIQLRLMHTAMVPIT